METIHPKSFMEIVGTVALAASFFFILLSLKENIRLYCHKLSGLLLLVAIGAYAENIWCYLAIVFIIGSTVTELDFLQNIAAIIRGSEAYFSYRKEFVSRKEIEKTISEEYRSAVELSNIGPEDSTTGTITFPLKQSSLTQSQLYVIVEELAFRTLERRYNETISRHVTYPEIGGYRMRFDGVIETKTRDILIEILVPPIPKLVRDYFKRNSSFFYSAHQYANRIKKDVQLSIYIVIDNIEEDDFQTIKKTASEMASTMKLKPAYSLDLLTYQEIGLK